MQAALVEAVTASFYLGPQAVWREAKSPKSWRIPVSLPPQTLYQLPCR